MNKVKSTKTQLAKSLGISRAMLYYQPKKPVKDLAVKEDILTVLSGNQAYGHKRIAIELEANKKKILRIMKKFDIKPFRRRLKRLRKKDDENQPASVFPNLVKNICPIRPNVIWASDFSYLAFQGYFVFLASIKDLFTREIVGWSIGTAHNEELVISALMNALDNTKTAPDYHHSDQGSEYKAEEYLNILRTNNIQISMSKKASPYENAFKESFYSHFKLELGDISRFADLGELTEAISQAIYYYNNQRIHTKLKMSPIKFKEQYLVQDDEAPDKFRFNRLPCPFLRCNLCTTYEHRPQDCRSFPHLHMRDFTSRLWEVVENYSICPLVFNVYEYLKKELWHKNW